MLARPVEAIIETAEALEQTHKEQTDVPLKNFKIIVAEDKEVNI